MTPGKAGYTLKEHVLNNWQVVPTTYKDYAWVVVHPVPTDEVEIVDKYYKSLDAALNRACTLDEQYLSKVRAKREEIVAAQAAVLEQAKRDSRNAARRLARAKSKAAWAAYEARSAEEK
jgi:hypothetical protein